MSKPDTSWSDCLLHLMSTRIATAGELGDVLTRFLMSSRTAAETKAVRDLLAPLDLGVVRSDAQSRGRFSLVIPPEGVALEAIYADTPWAADGPSPWRNTLLNAPVNITQRRSAKIGGQPRKAIIVSLQPALDVLGFSIIWTPPRPDQY
jgi:hypothetical protein